MGSKIKSAGFVLSTLILVIKEEEEKADAGSPGAAGEGRIGHDFGSGWYWYSIGLLPSCL